LACLVLLVPWSLQQSESLETFPLGGVNPHWSVSSSNVSAVLNFFEEAIQHIFPVSHG
jgi:hypothetical protein